MSSAASNVCSKNCTVLIFFSLKTFAATFAAGFKEPLWSVFSSAETFVASAAHVSHALASAVSSSFSVLSRDFFIIAICAAMTSISTCAAFAVVRASSAMRAARSAFSRVARSFAAAVSANRVSSVANKVRADCVATLVAISFKSSNASALATATPACTAASLASLSA